MHHHAGSAPKRGTSVGAERSLSANGLGGTCLTPFLSRAANSLPLRRVLRTPAHFFSPARHTRNSQNRIDDETRVPRCHRLAPGSPAHPARHRLGHTTAPSSIDKHSVLPPTATSHRTFNLSLYPAKSYRVQAVSSSSTCATFCVAPNTAFRVSPNHPPRTRSLTLSSIVHGSLTGPSPARYRRAKTVFYLKA